MSLDGYYIEDLTEGMTAVFGKTITDADILMFAGVSGDTNPVHLNEEFALGTAFHGRIAHGMLTASLISTVLGTKLPGPGCIYLSQNLKFLAPVRAGDTVRAEVTIRSIDREKRPRGLRHRLQGRRQDGALGRGAHDGAAPAGRARRLSFTRRAPAARSRARSARRRLCPLAHHRTPRRPPGSPLYRPVAAWDIARHAHPP